MTQSEGHRAHPIPRWPTLAGMLSALFQIMLLALIAAVTPIGLILSIALHDTPRPRANITAYVVGGALVYVLWPLPEPYLHEDSGIRQ